MKLPETKDFKWNYTAMAFAIPTVCMLVIYIICSYEPFGQYSLLYSDMYHQYYPFFYAFREAILSGESLLWNWSAGLGMDYLGLISYYLGSPLNLLSILVPEQWVLEYFCLLMPIKLGLASGFFAIMLKKLFGTDDFSITLFGCFYGMCAWALGYQWNIMWLDTFALLPLLMLGTVRLLRDKKVILYTVTLFLSVFINYYVGFFVCIFVLLFFFCYEICRFQSVGRFLADLGRIAIFTILAIGMTAILELPALAALQNTYSSVNKFPEGFAVNIVSGEAVTAAKEAWKLFREAKEAGTETFTLWWDAMKAAFPPLLEAMQKVAGNIGGGVSPTFKEGLPNLYCGVFPIALGFLFLLSKDVKLRDKICCVVLLVFFMLSFILRQLDYIWHGFHFTNQIPYRFSFLFSFVVLYMAYRAWMLRDTFRLWQVAAAGMFGAALVLWSGNSGNTAYLVYNLSFLGLYWALMGYYALTFQMRQQEKVSEQALPEEEAASQADIRTLLADEEEQPEAPKKFSLPAPETGRRYAGLAIAFVMTLELVLNVANFSANFPATYAGSYPRGTEEAASMFEVIEELEEDNPFYRVEVTHSQTLNDGALNGYNGITTFTSSANVKTTEFMQAWGFAARNNYNRYLFEEASPVANLFLALKYMVERDGNVEENLAFDVLHTYGKITLLENNAYLPLGFLAESELGMVDFFGGNTSFNLQNSIFQAATGLTQDVWQDMGKQDLEITGDGNVLINAHNSSGYCSYKAQAAGKLTYTYTISKEGLLCVDVNLPKRNSFAVYHNDALLYTESVSLQQMFSVCDVVPGDVVKIVIDCKAEESSSATIRSAVLDETVFRAGYDVLAASTWNLTECTTDYISGTIRCDRDGLMYTSVPQDGNWKVYVDGKLTDKTVQVGEVMLSVPLSEGVHLVEFRYENKAFEYGALISLSCALVFGGIVLADYLLRRKKEKQA